MIQALILAAGLSSRMGRFKPLIDLGGRTVLARAAATFQAAGVSSLIAVIGHQRAQMEVECARLGLRPVFNPDYRTGMFSSVQAGVQALSETCRAFFVLPVDIPLVRPWTVERLLTEFDTLQPLVACPRFLDHRGHPPLVSRQLLPAIQAHNGDGGLHRVLAGQADRTIEVDVFDRNILMDLDHPSDRELAGHRLAGLDRLDRQEAEALAVRVAGMSAAGLAHGRSVGLTAEALVRSLNQTGMTLDPELAYAGGLLHDLAKGAHGHEQAGGSMLRNMGLGPLADIVAAHRDIRLAEDAPISERELVYLADKLVRGSERASLEDRFQEKIDLHARDPEETRAIKQRRANARAVQTRIERMLGDSLNRFLPDLGSAFPWPAEIARGKPNEERLEVTVYQHIPCRFDLDGLMQELHILPETEEADELAALVDEARLVARPKAMFTEAVVQKEAKDSLLINGITFQSRVLWRLLSHGQQVFPFVITCGSELDRLGDGMDDVMTRYWLDRIKAAALQCSKQSMHRLIAERLQGAVASNISPGSGDQAVWPLEQQAGLFQLLGDVTGQIGVQLTESCLMVPTHSLSGLRFPSPEAYSSCQLCRREDCPSRSDAFDESLWQCLMVERE